MATPPRSPRPATPTPDEKIIEKYEKLIKEYIATANAVMTTANDSATEARELGKEFPSMQAQVDPVTAKVDEMTREFKAADAASDAAQLAAPAGNRATVEAKATEVSNHLGTLKKLDDERKALFDAAKRAADEKRPFKTAIDEITGIQKEIQGYITKATEKATTAQEELDKARDKFAIKALAVDKAQSFAPPVKEAETNLRNANSIVGALTTRKTQVDQALTNANNAFAANNKANAEAALQSAKAAKEEANKVALKAGIKEKEGDESQPTPKPPTDAGGHHEEKEEGTSAFAVLSKKLWGRLLVAGIELIAILFIVPGWLKPVFGLAWVILLVLSLAPNIGKNPRWEKAFWAFAGAVLLSIALSFFMPMFMGGESVTDAVKSSLPGHQEPTATANPQYVPTYVATVAPKNP